MLEDFFFSANNGNDDSKQQVILLSSLVASNVVVQGLANKNLSKNTFDKVNQLREWQIHSAISEILK